MAVRHTEPKLQDIDIITVEDLVVGYDDTIALNGVSFSVRQGEILTILGPSGCGKSTLLKVMAGLISPQRGRIRVVGEEITPENAGEAVARVRQHLGFLFQSGALFEFLTVAENVALPLEEFTDLPPELIAGIVQLKLDLVELGQYGHLMPGELSGHVFVFACERTGPISRAALQIEVSLIDTDEAPRRVIFRREYNLRSGPFAEDSSAAFAQAMSGLVAEFSLKLQQDLCAAQKN